jgi:phage terminase small subunit
MPILNNPRREKFAQLPAQGKTAVDAYDLAGFKQSDSNSSKMALRLEVAARVAEISGKAAERADESFRSTKNG